MSRQFNQENMNVADVNSSYQHDSPLFSVRQS